MNKRNSKISDQTKEQIYRYFMKTGAGYKEMAERFNVSTGTVKISIDTRLAKKFVSLHND
jgi:transposase-like protein